MSDVFWHFIFWVKVGAAVARVWVLRFRTRGFRISDLGLESSGHEFKSVSLGLYGFSAAELEGLSKMPVAFSMLPACMS